MELNEVLVTNFLQHEASNGFLERGVRLSDSLQCPTLSNQLEPRHEAECLESISMLAMMASIVVSHRILPWSYEMISIGSHEVNPLIALHGRLVTAWSILHVRLDRGL